MVHLIVGSGMIIQNDRRPTLPQLGISHQRSAHRLLNSENGTDPKIVTMSDMATDQGARRASGNRNSCFVEVVLLGVSLKKSNGLGAMIHDLEVILVGVNEKRIIHAGKSHTLGMIFPQHLATTETRFVSHLESTPMKVDHQRRRIFRIYSPEIKKAAIIFLAVSKIFVSRLGRQSSRPRESNG